MDCLRIALRDYNLKFATILNDPDLASFRALPEFKELQEEVLHSPFVYLFHIPRKTFSLVKISSNCFRLG